MLYRLTIRNYAIIEELQITFSHRMNIITGETGAGKSILVGALGLILGERADTKILFDKDEKCIVEADFELKNDEHKAFFEAHELDFEKHTIIRREINQSGKSRAFINDTPVTLAVLKELGEKLVNLHSQHETLDLIKAGFQLQVVDALAGNKPMLQTYRDRFSRYRKEQRHLTELTKQLEAASAELDYLQFQLKELAETNLKAGELEVLEAEQNTLGNVEEIKLVLQTTVQNLNGGEQAVLDQLNDVLGKLKTIKNYNKEVLELNNRLQSTYTELKDIAAEFENLQESTTLDPEKLEEVTNRLNQVYKLQKKHNAKTIEELLKIQADLEAKIASVDINQNEIELLKGKLDKELKELLTIADKLHSNREKVLRDFQNHTTVLLTKVGMPNASFKVYIKKLEAAQLNETGLTEMKFLFTANKGFAPAEIKDVASGGELSRLMLCIKSLVADADELPTLIFDEIDTGISGEVALKVGEIMKKLTREHQLICITHLPQIARVADSHFYIYKENVSNKTQTRIKELKGDDRVIELAKMLSGDKLSEAALANARELIAN